MISPHSLDAESYETTLALIGRVAPTMPPAARSRAAWAVATAKLDLAAALAAEGHSLHDARVAAPAADVARREAADREATAGFAAVQHAALGDLKPDAPDAARMLHTVVKVAGPAAGEDYIRRLNAPTPHAPRHRFDCYGPEVWSKSSNPKMIDFGRKIQWIAAHEAAGNPRFRNVAEAFAAYREANG